MSWQDMRKLFQSYDSRFPRRALPGVVSTIRRLHKANIVMGVVTSGQAEKVSAYMRQAKLPMNLFNFVHTSAEIGDDMAKGRPILRRALGELATRGITPAQTTFVGDEIATIRDAAGGGTDFVVVASGTVSRETLLRQQVPRGKLINRMSELPKHIGLER